MCEHKQLVSKLQPWKTRKQPACCERLAHHESISKGSWSNQLGFVRTSVPVAFNESPSRSTSELSPTSSWAIHRSPFCRDTSPRPGSWIKSMGGTWDSNKPSERVTLSRHQTYDETNPFDILCRQLEKRVTLSATYFLKENNLSWPRLTAHKAYMSYVHACIYDT